MSQAQMEVLKSNIEGAESGAYSIEQIYFLAGGNVSQDELTITTQGVFDGKPMRYVERFDIEGRTVGVLETELKERT